MSFRRFSAGRPAWHALTALLLALALAVAGPAAAPSRAAAADPVQITEGEGLLWGLKQSWRNYAGIGTWSGGVEHLGGTDGYRWPFRSGSYDPDTHRAELRFGGSVHWVAHEGALDVAISDPRLFIDGDEARIVARTVSKRESNGEMVDYGEITIVSVALRADKLAVAGGRTTWSGLATTLTAEGRAAFSNNYPVGTAMDPVTTTYTGPGGLPRATGENFTPDGAIAWREVARVAPATTRNAYAFHLDPVNQVVHAPVGGGDGLIALNPDTLAPVGTPLGANPSSMFDGYPATTFDRFTSTVFDSAGSNTYGFRWSGATQSYTQETMPGTAFRANALHYDLTGRRLFAARGDELVSWKHDGAAWVQTVYTRAGVEMNAESRSTLSVDARGNVLVTSAGARPIRVVIVGTTATASYLPGDYSDPEASQEQFNQPSAANPIPGAAGGFYLSNYAGQVFQARQDEDGALRQVAPRLDRRWGTVLASAIDSSGSYATFMVADFSLSTIGFVEAGRGAGELRLDRAIGASVMSPIAIAPGAAGSIYVNASGEQRKYARDGYAPHVTTAPQGAVVPLATGVERGSATFSAAATARGVGATDATPAIRWQTRAGDSGRFTDLPGATEASVTLDAGADDNGRQVRAVFTNPFGIVASQPAAVTVNTAAKIAVQPSDVAVTAGQTAELKVMPVGNPAPQIQWQTKVGAFWADVDAESGDFSVDGGFLRVPNASVAMNGAQFRARLRNRITPGSDAWSTVFSRTVTLSVAAPVTSAVTFGGGHLDWGFANRWRCYVVGNVARGAIVPSGGATQVPGTLANGQLCTGRDAGSEIVRFGIRGGSFDPATGALELRLRGSVRFWGHDYHVPGSARPQLDTTVSNVRLVATGTRGTLYADVVGATMEAPIPVSRTNVPLVSVTLPDGPVARTGGVDWSGLETTLTAEGSAVFGSYPAGEAFDPIAVAADFGTPEPEPRPEPKPEPKPEPEPQPRAQAARATIAAGSARVALKRSQRVALVARVRCPARGGACTVKVPARVALKIAGRRHLATVLAPRRVAAGRTATVRVQLTREAAARLTGRTAAVRVRVTATAAGTRATTRDVTVTLKGAPSPRGAAKKK